VPGTNTYLLGTGSRRLLIDTGEGIAAYEPLLSSVLESEGCTIGAVLLTHWHHDHVQGIPQVSKLCPPATFSKFSVNGDEEYLPIRDGDEFAVQGARVRAFHTPGHTTDHTVFWMEDSGVLFTGDSILGQGTAVFENLSTYISSLKRQLSLHPTALYPGHGPVIEGKAATEKIQEYIDHRQQREDEIIKVMMEEGEVTAMEIVKIIYAKYPQSLWPAAERGVKLHLDKLKDEGRAKEIEGGKWVLISRQSSL
jgi:endoribonuclease LACTB2